MTKIIRIKVGEVYVNNKPYSVFQKAFERKSDNGLTYHEIRMPVFSNTIEDKKKEDKKKEVMAE